MTNTATRDIVVDNSYATSVQPEIFSEDMRLTNPLSAMGTSGEEQDYSKSDFEHALRKVSHRIKK